jgi:hypothetical protein
MHLAYNYDAPSHKFTGKERDSESNLNNFGARFDAPSMGRFCLQAAKIGPSHARWSERRQNVEAEAEWSVR